MAVIVVSFSNNIGLFLPKRTYTSPNWKPTAGHEKITRSHINCSLYNAVTRRRLLQPAGRHNRTRFHVVVYFIFHFFFLAPFLRRGACSVHRPVGNRAHRHRDRRGYTVFIIPLQVCAVYRGTVVTSAAFKCRNFHAHRKTSSVSQDAYRFGTSFRIATYLQHIVIIYSCLEKKSENETARFVVGGRVVGRRVITEDVLLFFAHSIAALRSRIARELR